MAQWGIGAIASPRILTVIYLLICSAAFLTAAVTLFCGFGLATLLLPVFAIFFPIEAAVAMTAIVHLTNNVTKVALLARHASVPVVLGFGLPAALAAPAGAVVLVHLSRLDTLIEYPLGSATCHITAAKLIVAGLMLFFATWQFLPTAKNLRFAAAALPLGGVLSGFLGGLSGHQGAMRSAFLLRCDLSKEAFIATGAVIACLVDVGRLLVYGAGSAFADDPSKRWMILVATLSAITGTFLTKRLIPKVTIRVVHALVSVMLFVLAGALAVGLI